MSDVNYCEWANYIETIFKEYSLKPKTIVDLGCGTGNFSLEMAKRGYSMIGIDISTEMLSLALLKLESQKIKEEKILFLHQDMTNFELYGTVDVIVSLIDSINYITDKNDLKRMINLVKNYLNPGGLFIFDINTVYKFEKILHDNIFYSIDEEITYIWENIYNTDTKLCKFDLTFFVLEEECYKRFDEIHTERAYSIKELRSTIEKSGLRLLKICDELSFREPRIDSERLFFICKKCI